MLTEKEINGALKSLQIAIPEFADSVSKYIADDFGYAAFERFADFLKELIDKNGSPELIDGCYNYVNELSENNNKSIQEWLTVTFLESMIQESKYIKLSRTKLKGKALILFEEIIASGYWNINL